MPSSIRKRMNGNEGTPPGRPAEDRVGDQPSARKKIQMKKKSPNELGVRKMVLYMLVALVIGTVIVVVFVLKPEILEGMNDRHDSGIRMPEREPDPAVTELKTDVDPTNTPLAKKDKANAVYDWMKGPSLDPKLKLFNLNEIAYVEDGKMYLVLIGHVFDVTGAEFYRPGSGYHAFVGRDASRSFVTGEFDEKALTDDVEGLDHSAYLGLVDWLKFYLNHDTYRFVGYLNGRYYGPNRSETPAMKKLKSLVLWAKEEAAKDEDLLKLFPSCNSEWKSGIGSRVWCSPKSGGVDREWTGYPRLFFEKPTAARRCACVHPNYLADARVKEYEGCKRDSESCMVPNSK